MKTDHHEIQEGFEKSNFQLSYLPIAARVEIWNFGVVELVGLCVLGCNCGAVRRVQSRRHSCENGALCQRRQPGTASSIGRSIIIFQRCISFILHFLIIFPYIPVMHLFRHFVLCNYAWMLYKLLYKLNLLSPLFTVQMVYFEKKVPYNSPTGDNSRLLGLKSL